MKWQNILAIEKLMNRNYTNVRNWRLAVSATDVTDEPWVTQFIFTADQKIEGKYVFIEGCPEEMIKAHLIVVT